MKSKSYLHWILTSVLIAGTLTSAAPPNVKLRNLEPAPGLGYSIYTDADGKAFWAQNANGAIDVNLTAIGFIPTASGNTTNFNEVVIDPNGDQWIIDQQGDAVKTSTNTSVAAADFSTATISAGGEMSMFVRYSGSNAPTLTQTIVGQYSLSIPLGTTLLGFHWTGNDTHTTGSNTVELTITTTNSELLYANYTVLNALTGAEFGQNQSITINQTTPTTGQVTAVFPNMSNFGATGFIIIGKPV
ncbi:MAG: hypothetical protein AAFP77_19680 [Bacteroidota bacterium]